MPQKIAGITSEAVVDATGNDWDGWLSILDDVGATELEHKAIVAALADAGVESGWWQQQIAVGYEHARGIREVGETADAGFQIGVQRTLPIAQDTLWNLLMSREGLDHWLGPDSNFELTPGDRYETANGIYGELRTVHEGERIRLTWQPDDWESPSTLQLTLQCPRNTDEKTVLRVHQENLADSETRDEMRAHWRAVLDTIETLLPE